MASHETTHEPGVHAHHITPQSTLIVIAIALFFLMALTIGAAVLMPEPLRGYTVFMNLLALGIATVKAYLVVAYYMGVKYATKLTKLFAIGGFVWFLTLGITLIDYSSRQIEPVPGWEKQEPMALPRDPASPEINR